MDELVQLLQNNNLLRDVDEVRRFISALDHIQAQSDPTIIPQLFLVFTDNCEHMGPMQTLQTYIEQLDMDIWIPALLKVSSDMVENAKNWMEEFYAHLLNDDMTRLYLRKLYSELNDSDKKNVSIILLHLTEPDWLGDELRADLQTKVNFVLSNDA